MAAFESVPCCQSITSFKLINLHRSIMVLLTFRVNKLSSNPVSSVNYLFLTSRIRMLQLLIADCYKASRRFTNVPESRGYCASLLTPYQAEGSSQKVALHPRGTSKSKGPSTVYRFCYIYTVDYKDVLNAKVELCRRMTLRCLCCSIVLRFRL